MVSTATAKQNRCSCDATLHQSTRSYHPAMRDANSRDDSPCACSLSNAQRRREVDEPRSVHYSGLKHVPGGGSQVKAVLKWHADAGRQESGEGVEGALEGAAATTVWELDCDVAVAAMLQVPSPLSIVPRPVFARPHPRPFRILDCGAASD